jgi:hypothetical protein
VLNCAKPVKPSSSNPARQLRVGTTREPEKADASSAKDDLIFRAALSGKRAPAVDTAFT